MKNQQRRSSTSHDRLLKQCFEILSVKFILNLPAQEKSQSVRLAYHYLKAYYYYIDEMIKQYFPSEDPKKVEGKWFYDQLNAVVGKYIKKVEAEDVIKIMSKHRPSCGAIILNERENKVLVVQWNGRYGFPKGGKNQGQTCQDCAARQVKQEVGLFIHNKINSNEKVEFLGRADVPVTFFIVRNFDQNQPIKVDKNELDNAFWMNISEVSKQAHRFTQRCRRGWKLFEQSIRLQPKLSIEQFLKVYRDRPSKMQKKDENEIETNPLLNFQLDRQRLFAVFKAVQNQTPHT